MAYAVLAAALLGCPMHNGDDRTMDDGDGRSMDDGDGRSMDDGRPPATQRGIVSIQDISIHGAPQAGHGLTVTVLFAEPREPQFEEAPGEVTGCKAWRYDRAENPAPPLTDQGTLTIQGLAGGEIECMFAGEAGYVCPTARGSGAISTTTDSSGTVTYAIEKALLSGADVGRYLQVGGASSSGNNGAFPIVAVDGEDTARVVNRGGSDEAFRGEYSVLAGAGPVPNNPLDPITADSEVSVTLSRGGGMAFDVPEIGPITAGGEFELDDDSKSIIASLPLDGSAIAFGCKGSGGDCGTAQGTLVRITTSDGSTQGLTPAAMPPPDRQQIEIQCLTQGGDGTVELPPEIAALLARAHDDSPITRVRTAYMREGLALTVNAPPNPPNQLFVAVGHGVLGFTSPP